MTEPVTLTIELKPDGNLSITGPLGNEMLTRFLLDKARAEMDRQYAVQAAMAQAQQQRILPANGGGGRGFLRGQG